MTAWFIIGPRGAVYRDYYGNHFVGQTRKAAICQFFNASGQYNSTIDDLWSEHEALGYRCEKRRVVE